MLAVCGTGAQVPTSTDDIESPATQDEAKVLADENLSGNGVLIVEFENAADMVGPSMRGPVATTSLNSTCDTDIHLTTAVTDHVELL